MRYKTNLDAVKHVAISLLHTHINETKFSPMVVQHPFTSSGFVGISNNGEMELLNILESMESKKKWQEFMERQITNADSVYRIFMMVNKPYALTFLKLASKHLSFDDFSRILGDAWVMSENPNGDANVTKGELIGFFEAADPEVIMTPEERKQLDELDDIVTVYNGTTFPEYDYTGSSLITVELSYYDNTEYLYLPDDDWAIVKAVARLGADSVDDCKCLISDISTDIGGTKKMLNDVLEYEDLFAVNKITSYINIADMDLKKLQALIEYADATDSTTICVLAERIDDFTYIEDIEDDEDIGKYFVENDEDYSVGAELEDFIKYDELGEHLREEMDGKFGEHGYVSMNNQVDTLEQILEEYSGQIRGVTMGGI